MPELNPSASTVFLLCVRCGSRIRKHASKCHRCGKRVHGTPLWWWAVALVLVAVMIAGMIAVATSHTSPPRTVKRDSYLSCKRLVGEAEASGLLVSYQGARTIVVRDELWRRLAPVDRKQLTAAIVCAYGDEVYESGSETVVVSLRDGRVLGRIPHTDVP